MANVINFIQTNAADELISKVLTGKTLNFTRMAVGDGFSYDMNVAKGFKTLVNEVLSLDITKKETLSPKSVKITSAFKNTDAQKEFYYREVGLYAQDPDTGEEVLYAYGNRNDAAELITPAGSNVVTKQLVFIIAVGDSANVTFNVNADVYALQEDMLDVQENKANKNLSNTGMITNCLLEVPQRIKCNITDGYITLKAGSVVIVPFGTEAPTYSIGDNFWSGPFKVVDIQYDADAENPKLFYWLELPEDLTETGTQTDPYGTILINTQSNAFMPYQELYAGDTPPTPNKDWSVWYDTANNFIKYSNNTGVTWNTIGTSLPVLTYAIDDNGIYGSITQIFNGMGYIGSTVWVDKGIKGLIPNGRNADGTLKNIEITTDKLFVKDSYEDISRHCFLSKEGKIIKYGSDNYFESETPPIFDGNICRWLDTKRNLMFITEDAGNNWFEFVTKEVYIGELIKYTNQNITSFKLKTPFQAVDYNSYSNKITELESRISALETI